MKRVVLVVLIGVVALSACSSPTPVPVVTVVLPTVVVPTRSAPTNVPVPSIAPIGVPTQIPAPAPTAQRVAFQQGQFNTVVNGKLATNGMDKWVLRIVGGQTLSVNLVPTNGKAKISIVGADGTVLISDHADAMQWSGQTPASQDYIIAVVAFGSTAPSYTMQITIPPNPLPTALPGPTPVAKRISFERGGTTTTVAGTTPTVSVDRWVIAAQAGQTMMVNLVPAQGGQAAVVIFGVDGTVLISDHASARQWSGTLPKTQDYFIDIKPEANSTVSYQLQVTIPPR